MRKATRACSWVVAAGLLAGCGAAQSGAEQSGEVAGDESTGATGREATPSTASADLRAISAAWAGFISDYSPVSGPQELAELAGLAGAGRITSVGFGRTEVFPVDDVDNPGETEDLTYQLSAIEIEFSEVIKGDAQPGDSIWLETRGDPTLMEKDLPTGLDVVVYAQPAEPQSVMGTPYDLTKSEIPEGESVWYLAHPQGLIIAYRPDEGTVMPLIGEIEPAEELEESLPLVP